jgi:hypothetical protein
LESSWCNREQYYLLVVVVLEDRHDNERTAKKEVVNANRDQTTTINDNDLSDERQREWMDGLGLPQKSGCCETW